MKNQFKLIIIALCCVVTVLQSCKKEENQQVSNPQKSVSTFGVGTVNGRLKFANNDQAIAKMAEISNLDSTQLADWENQVGYKSYSSFRHKAIMENFANYIKDGSSAPEIEFDHSMSEAYSRVLNQDGEMQIGDSIVFISANKYVVCPLLGEKELQDIKTKLSAKQKVGLTGIRVFDIKTDTLKPASKSDLKTIRVNNTYQSVWHTNGFDFKLVFKATYSNGWYEVTNYMEYYRTRSWPGSSSWESAGQGIQKEYVNLRLSGSPRWDWSSVSDNTSASHQWGPNLIGGYFISADKISAQTTGFISNNSMVQMGTIWN